MLINFICWLNEFFALLFSILKIFGVNVFIFCLTFKKTYVKHISWLKHFESYLLHSKFFLFKLLPIETLESLGAIKIDKRMPLNDQISFVEAEKWQPK